MGNSSGTHTQSSVARQRLSNLKNTIPNLAKSMGLNAPLEKMSRCVETYFLAREPGR